MTSLEMEHGERFDADRLTGLRDQTTAVWPVAWSHI